MTYAKIHYDDSVYPPIELIELPDQSDSREWLQACYKAIECDCIETVPTVISGLILIIDESGKLKDGWETRYNTLATVLYGRYGLVDPITGNAILARVQGDEIVPLTPSDIERVTRLTQR